MEADQYLIAQQSYLHDITQRERLKVDQLHFSTRNLKCQITHPDFFKEIF